MQKKNNSREACQHQTLGNWQLPQWNCVKVYISPRFRRIYRGIQDLFYQMRLLRMKQIILKRWLNYLALDTFWTIKHQDMKKSRPLIDRTSTLWPERCATHFCNVLLLWMEQYLIKKKIKKNIKFYLFYGIVM